MTQHSDIGAGVFHSCSTHHSQRGGGLAVINHPSLGWDLIYSCILTAGTSPFHPLLRKTGALCLLWKYYYPPNLGGYEGDSKAHSDTPSKHLSSQPFPQPPLREDLMPSRLTLSSICRQQWSWTSDPPASSKGHPWGMHPLVYVNLEVEFWVLCLVGQHCAASSTLLVLSSLWWFFWNTPVLQVLSPLKLKNVTWVTFPSLSTSNLPCGWAQMSLSPQSFLKSVPSRPCLFST